MRGPSLRATATRVAVVVMAVAFAASCACVPLRPLLDRTFGGAPVSTVVDLVLYNVVYVSAAAGLFLHASPSRRDAVGWRVLAVGMLCTAVGNVWFSLVLAQLPVVPYPSLSDAFYLCWYPACYLAIVLVLTAHVGRFPLSVWLDGLVAGAGVAAVAAALWFRPLTAVDPSAPCSPSWPPSPTPSSTCCSWSCWSGCSSSCAPRPATGSCS